MQNTSYRLRNISLALILACCATAIHAQSKSIELQTDEGLLTIPLKDSPGLQLLSDGSVSATAEDGFICQQGDSCEDVTVSLSEINGGDFSLSDSTVTQGIDFQISWNARGAWDCTGSGLTGTDWNTDNPKQPRGTETISSDDLAADSYEVRIECKNGPASAARVLPLTIEEPTGDVAGCDDVLSLDDYSGWARSTDSVYPFGIVDPQTFDDIFTTWPGGGNSDLVSLDKGTYLAAAFNSGPLNSGSDGDIRKESPQGEGAGITGADLFIVSISECPGDFDPDSTAIADGCIRRIRTVDQFTWGGPGSGMSCELEANTDYFVNIVYTRSEVGELPPEQAPCDGKPRCGHNYAPRGEF